MWFDYILDTLAIIFGVFGLVCAVIVYAFIILTSPIWFLPYCIYTALSR
jgi:hypothetical protein